jgi:HSP20 family protein
VEDRKPREELQFSSDAPVRGSNSGLEGSPRQIGDRQVKARRCLCYDSKTVAFVRWDPFRDLIAIQHRLERLAATGPHGWAPAVDLCETDTAFIITAELPGLTREQIKIDVHDGRLTVQGRRDARVRCEHYHQVERGHGEFARAFALPATVDAAAIKADLTNGVLTIVAPKSVPNAPRQVDIK